MSFLVVYCSRCILLMDGFFSHNIALSSFLCEMFRGVVIVIKGNISSCCCYEDMFIKQWQLCRKL